MNGLKEILKSGYSNNGHSLKISAPIDTVLNSLDSLLNFIPFPIILFIFVFFAYRTNGLKFAIFSFISLVFIDLVDLWSESMTTLAMIFTAVLFCMLIGIPLGIHHCFKK